MQQRMHQKSQVLHDILDSVVCRVAISENELIEKNNELEEEVKQLKEYKSLAERTLSRLQPKQRKLDKRQYEVYQLRKSLKVKEEKLTAREIDLDERTELNRINLELSRELEEKNTQIEVLTDLLNKEKIASYELNESISKLEQSLKNHLFNCTELIAQSNGKSPGQQSPNSMISPGLSPVIGTGPNSIISLNGISTTADLIDKMNVISYELLTSVTELSNRLTLTRKNLVAAQQRESRMKTNLNGFDDATQHLENELTKYKVKYEYLNRRIAEDQMNDKHAFNLLKHVQIVYSSLSNYISKYIVTMKAEVFRVFGYIPSKIAKSNDELSLRKTVETLGRLLSSNTHSVGEDEYAMTDQDTNNETTEGDTDYDDSERDTIVGINRQFLDNQDNDSGFYSNFSAATEESK